jgi:hypothetical protein
MSRRLTIVALLVLAVCAVRCAPASAHPGLETTVGPSASTPIVAPPIAPSTMARAAAPTPPVVPWAAMLAAAAALIVAWRRPRRALALAIVLILGLFAFENGVHSVHHLNDLRHLDDLRSGAICHVAAATAHVAGTLVDGVTPEHPVLPSRERLVLQHHLSVDALFFAAHQGRAPPISA